MQRVRLGSVDRAAQKEQRFLKWGHVMGRGTLRDGPYGTVMTSFPRRPLCGPYRLVRWSDKSSGESKSGSRDGETWSRGLCYL